MDAQYAKFEVLQALARAEGMDVIEDETMPAYPNRFELTAPEDHLFHSDLKSYHYGDHVTLDIIEHRLNAWLTDKEKLQAEQESKKAMAHLSNLVDRARAQGGKITRHVGKSASDPESRYILTFPEGSPYTTRGNMDLAGLEQKIKEVETQHDKELF